MADENAHSKTEKLVLSAQLSVASKKTTQPSKPLVLTADQLVPKPNAQKPFVLSAAAQIKPIQAKPLRLAKPKSKQAADQDNKARAGLEQCIAAVLSNVEISISGYDLSSAEGNSFDAEAEAYDWQYRQLIASLHATRLLTACIANHTPQLLHQSCYPQPSSNHSPISRFQHWTERLQCIAPSRRGLCCLDQLPVLILAWPA